MNINWKDISFTKNFTKRVDSTALWIGQKAPFGKEITYGVSRFLLYVVANILQIAEAAFKGIASITLAPLLGRYNASKPREFAKLILASLITVVQATFWSPAIIYYSACEYDDEIISITLRGQK